MELIADLSKYGFEQFKINDLKNIQDAGQIFLLL
jgi:hypothetical protein